MPREPSRLHITEGNIYDGLNECGSISNGTSISGISRALNNNIQGKISAVVQERFCVENMAYTHIHSATPGKILCREYGIHSYTLRHCFKETYRDFARTKQSFNGKT